MTLPSSSAVVPAKERHADRHGLEEEPLFAIELDDLDKVRRRARALPRALLSRVDEGIEAGLGDEAGTPRRHVAHQLRKHALGQRIGFDLVLGSEAHKAR